MLKVKATGLLLILEDVSPPSRGSSSSEDQCGIPRCLNTRWEQEVEGGGGPESR